MLLPSVIFLQKGLMVQYIKVQTQNQKELQEDAHRRK